MTIMRFAWAIFTWVLYLVFVSLLPSALGFVLVPFAILFGVRRESRIAPGRMIFTAPDWLGWWGNEQDGYDPEWAVTTIYKDWPTFLRRYSWAAWRNKASNVRFITWLHPPPDPERIAFIQHATWSLCWQGWLCHWEWHRAKGWTEIGWRYEPKDKQGVAADDWRRHGCGFAARLFGRLP